MRGVLIGDVSVQLANVDGQDVAYHGRCPGSALPLHGGMVDGAVLVCPWHRCRFDLRDGRRLDEHRPDGNLEHVALSLDQDELRIGIPEAGCVKRALVACVGNVLRRDDGFGVAVAQELGEGLPSGVHLIETGIGGVAIVYKLMEGYDTLVVVDAIHCGAQPGTMVVLER